MTLGDDHAELFMKLAWTSTGSDEPPAAATRRWRAMRSTSTEPRPSSARSAPNKPQYIVGTPAKNVMSAFLEQLKSGVGLEPGQHDQGAAEGRGGILAEGMEEGRTHR